MEELMALLLEEVSLLTSQRTRPEPLDVPRPESFKAAVRRVKAAAAGASQVHHGPESEPPSDVPLLRADGGVTAVGHRAVLALMSGQGAVMVAGGDHG